MAEEDDQPYPLDPEKYTIREEIGRGPSSIVFRAICTEMDSAVVAIKVIDIEKSDEDIEELRREARLRSHLNIPALVRAHCFFTVDASIWVVMPFMLGGSLQSIMASSYPNGLPESCIAAVLKQTLITLSHLHGQFNSHGYISASNILIDSNGSVRLADSSMSSRWFFKISPTSRYWMPAGVRVDDIWSFGMTALELAHGRPPISNSVDQLSPSMNISPFFKHMVGACLDLNPWKRPKVHWLLMHPFFYQNYGGINHLMIKNMLPEEERIDRLLRKTTDDEDGGEVCMWKFNEERFVLDPIHAVDIDDYYLDRFIL